MPISISQAQAKALGSGFLDDIGSNEIPFNTTTNILEQIGISFIENIGKRANQKQVVASGKLLSETTFRIVNNDTVQIIMPDYFDYPNEGVKGVKSSKNAPNSPYQFKNYGMSAAGRKSITDYIQTGKAKIKTVRRTKDKALGIGREKKHLSLIDIQTNTLIFLIKRQGIKHTGYFDMALNDTVKDIENSLGQAIANDIVISLNKLNVSRN